MVDVSVNLTVSFTIADSWMVDNWSSNQALTTGEEDLTAKRRVESRGRKYILPKLNLGKFSRKRTVAKCFVRFSKTSSAIKRFDFSIISVWLLNVVFQLAFFLPPKIHTCQFFVYFQASSVSNICLSDFIFPPKNLEKYRRPKYACADFFLWWWILRFYFCCYLINVNKLSVVCSLLYCVIFIFLSIKSFESSTSIFLTIFLLKIP